MRTELELAQAFMEIHPEDAASTLEGIGPADAALLMSELDATAVSTVIARMQPHAGAECLRRFRPEFAGELLKTMHRDHSALLLRRMGATTRESLLQAAPAEVASGLALLLRFPENTAGALMDPNPLSLPEEIGVAEALEYVRRSGARVSYYLYVTDRQSRLRGVVNLRELIEAPEENQLSDVARTPVSRLSVHDDPLAMAAHPGWLEHYALPVVDDSGVLVGILRHKTLRALAAESDSPQALNPFDVSLALGEMYWSTLGRFARMLWAVREDEQTSTGEMQ